MEFMYKTLRDIVSVIRNQWGDRLQTFKVFTCCGLLNVRRTNQTS